jgi:hypothetical protein
MGKYTGRPSPAEWLANAFSERGINVDPERLEDRVAAERERREYDHDQLTDRVRALASMVKRAKGTCEVEEWAWRQNPSAENLSAAMAAQKSRNEAEQILLEVCQNDRSLMSAVLRRT